MLRCIRSSLFAGTDSTIDSHIAVERAQNTGEDE
jgi:hypothetical protein